MRVEGVLELGEAAVVEELDRVPEGLVHELHGSAIAEAAARRRGARLPAGSSRCSRAPSGARSVSLSMLHHACGPGASVSQTWSPGGPPAGRREDVLGAAPFSRLDLGQARRGPPAGCTPSCGDAARRAARERPAVARALEPHRRAHRPHAEGDLARLPGRGRTCSVELAARCPRRRSARAGPKPTGSTPSIQPPRAQLQLVVARRPRTAACGGTGSGTMAASTPGLAAAARARALCVEAVRAAPSGRCARSKYSSSSSGLKRRTYLSRPVRMPWATKPRWLISETAGGSGAPPAQHGLQRPARDHGRRRAPAGPAPRGRWAGRRPPAPAGRRGGPASRWPRELHDQRDADQLVEHAAAVEPLAVVQELLAVVGHEDDERAVVEAAGLQLAHEAAELLVAVRDRRRRTARSGGRGRAAPCSRCAGRRPGWSGVGCGSYLRSKGAGGVYGHVRVHGVHVEEGREAAARVEPAQRRVHHRRPPPRPSRAGRPAPCRPGEEVEALLEVRCPRSR